MEYAPNETSPLAGTEEVAAVNWSELLPGTAVQVQTQNSTYSLVKLDGVRTDTVVRGGSLFDAATEGRVEGSTAGGSLIRSCWILKDFRLEIAVGRRHVVTSPIRSIRVERGIDGHC